MYNRQVLVTTAKDLIKELEKYDENMKVYVSGCDGYLYVNEEDGYCSFDDSWDVIALSDEYCDDEDKLFYFDDIKIDGRYYSLMRLMDEDIIDEDDKFGCTLPKK